jgi:hypothetical protein
MGSVIPKWFSFRQRMLIRNQGLATRHANHHRLWSPLGLQQPQLGSVCVCVCVCVCVYIHKLRSTSISIIHLFKPCIHTNISKSSSHTAFSKSFLCFNRNMIHFSDNEKLDPIISSHPCLLSPRYEPILCPHKSHPLVWPLHVCQLGFHPDQVKGEDAKPTVRTLVQLSALPWSPSSCPPVACL